MLAFDDEVYVYPYGFKTLGNLSPMFYLRGRDPAVQFFRKQFKKVWKNSTPAEELYPEIDLSEIRNDTSPAPGPRRSL